jgi:methyl-accepting chemotaxis protein
MGDAPLPSSRELRERIFWHAIAVGTMSLPLILTFLAPALSIGGEQLPLILGLIGAIFAPLTVASRFLYFRWLRPAAAYLDRHALGSADDADARAAFAAVMRFPHRLFFYGLCIWAGGASLLGFLMWRLDETWTLTSLLVLAAAGLSGGFVAQVFGYVWFRRHLESLRNHLAEVLTDTEERAALIRPLPLAAKLMVTIGGMILVTQIFGVCLSLIRARDAVEEFASVQQQSALDLVDQELELGSPIDPAISQARRAAQPFGIEVALLDYDGETLTGTLPLVGREVRWILSAEEDAGDSRSMSSVNSFAWRPMPEADGILVAAISAENLAAALPTASFAIVFNVLIFTLMAVGISLVVARDFSRTTGILARSLEHIATGELRDCTRLESDDEYGDLSRALERTVGFLRTTLSAVSASANQVETASAEVSSASENVAEATADQVRSTRQVSESMLHINEQIESVTSTAAALDWPIEESASALAALGAAGGRLTSNASSLSEKVDTVSGSVLQMISSIAQVSDRTQSMASSTVEAASSVQEMATAANDVQRNAVETARLSIEVVEASEKGRDRVGQTIEGMTAIRESSEAAESVIRTLGERTAEISDILQLIDDVADETNLLALNAAIIAAQAGERGRAFAVVADQIKALARRVLTGTKDIGGRIGALQEESARAVEAVERGTRSVALGVELSAEAGIALEEINRSAQESGDRVAQIVAAVSQQTRAASQVSELMEQLRTEVDDISDACRQQRHGSEIVRDGSEAIQGMARELHGTAERQSHDTEQISRGIESVRKAVVEIHAALNEQSVACRQVAGLLEEVHGRSQSNETSAQDLEGAGRSLENAHEALRESVARFDT